MKTYFVVTGVLRHKDKVLLLQKASDDSSYPNKWSFCSGYAKEFESAEDGVLREIKEETGLTAEIVKQGDIILLEDEKLGRKWIVLCFLCTTDSDNVKLCHENQQFEWVLPDDIKNYDLVPGLKKDLKTLGLL